MFELDECLFVPPQVSLVCDMWKTAASLLSGGRDNLHKNGSSGTLILYANSVNNDSCWYCFLDMPRG